MNIKATRETLLLTEIKISKPFRKTRVTPKKIHDAYAYYTNNGEFDRDIVVVEDNVLTDGYAAYLIAKMLDIKTVPVIRVSVSTNADDKTSEMENPDASRRSKYDGMTNRELDFSVCDMGKCSALGSNGKRKADCPLLSVCPSPLDAHPEMRETLIQYLLNEEKPAPKARGLALKILCSGDSCGIVGTPTSITDVSGEVLCVGDVVEWYAAASHRGSDVIISYGDVDFISGWKDRSDGAKNGEFTATDGYRVTFKKAKSWRDLTLGERLNQLTVVEA